MPKLVKIAETKDLTSGQAAAFDLEGQRIALFNVEGTFYATQSDCLHMGGPLGHGELEGCVLSCPWHGWQYDVRTGENEFDRALKLETFETVVEDGEVKVVLSN